MNLRIRPKSDYLQQAEWSELYVLAKHWQSDMEFYRDELRFLRGLVDKYFIWLIRDENIAQVQDMTGKLSEAGQNHEQLHERLKEHLKLLEGLISKSSNIDKVDFRKKHIELEDRITDFFKAFRSLKKEVFAMTEHVVSEEKLKHLLTP